MANSLAAIKWRSLNTKLSVLVVTVVVWVAVILGLYFDGIIKSHFRLQAQQQIEHAFDRLAFNLATIEHDLSEGVAFAQTDHKFVASVDLINRYQDKNNYNTFLLDEEKKLIAQSLLAQTRLTFNQQAVLFDQNGELIAFVEKINNRYLTAFISFDGGTAKSLVRFDGEPEFHDAGAPEQRIALQHMNFYEPKEAIASSVMTYHRVGDTIAIRSHLQLYSANKGQILGHVEMSRILDETFFSSLSRDTGISLRASFASPHAAHAQWLGEDLNMPAIVQIPSDDEVVGVLKKKAIGGEAYFTASMDSESLSSLLTQSRLQLALLLIGIVSGTVLVARKFIHKTLELPLQSLHDRLEKIRNQDYSLSDVLSTRDELEEISVAINHLTAAISEREQELEGHRRHLEDLVEQRTIELRDALQRAEAASVAKSAFLANMSHEIRTPLNAITGMAHLIQKSGLDTVQSVRMNKLLTAGEHLLSIISDVLDLSKIEANKLILENADFSLQVVFANLMDLIGARAAEKGLHVAAEIDPSLPTLVSGDRLRISQILLNFSNNAVKFTETGRIVLRARLVGEGAEGTTVRFEVADTGIGLSAEQQARLFQPFEQADASTTRKYGGTGLGLAISKRLAEMMHGQIGVDSQQGSGSTFWFEACFAHATSQVLPESGPGTVESSGAVNLQGCRILLAEDNPVNQEVAMELLREAGALVEVAADGLQAVELAEKNDYDCILMDMQMPNMDGVSATIAIRRLPDRAAVPILAMTANAFAEDREVCLAAGMNDHIAKPVNPALMFATLLKWLPQRAGWEGEAITVPSSGAGDGPAIDEATAAMMDKLSSLPGFDVATGLSVMNGKAGKLIELVTQFVMNHGEDMRRLSALLDAGNFQAAGRIAHSLKGTAGTIGAMQIAGLARQIDELLRGMPETPLDRALVDELMAGIDGGLSTMAALVATSSSPAAESEPAAAMAPEAMRMLLDQLKALLGDGDIQALELFRKHEPQLRQRLGGHFDPIAQCIRQFDFLNALEILRKSLQAES